MSMAVSISNLMDEDSEYFGEIFGKDVPQYSLQEFAEHYSVNCLSTREKSQNDPLSPQSTTSSISSNTTSLANCISNGTGDGPCKNSGGSKKNRKKKVASTTTS